MKLANISRRRFVSTTAAASATVIAAPFVRTAHAAGKLSIGLWDHWVPGANNTSRALIEEWAAKEKVEVQIDYITSQGEKLLMTAAMESQSKSGHDILNMRTWWPHEYAKNLTPVDDIVEPLIKQNGAVNETVKYLARADGHWLAVPSTPGSNIKGPCSRIDLLKQHAGIDVQAMYPAGQPPKADGWTLDAFLKAAEACHKAGFPFGIGLGTTTDSVDTVGAIFQSLRRDAGRCQREDHGQDRRRAPGARLLRETCQVLPARCPGVGRRHQQQVARGGQGRAHHEPAERLGRRQAGCAPDRRATVDARHAVGAEGALCTVRILLLGHLELQQEQVGGQEPARAPVAAGGHRKARGGQPGLRPAPLRQPDDAEDLGRGGAAEGHALPLSQSRTTTRSCRSRRRPRPRRSRSRSTPRA